jgi:hypothetical protein
MSTPEALKNKIKHWIQLKQWMAKAKTDEAKLRKELALELFGTTIQADGSYPEGTNKCDAGIALAKLVQKRNVTVLVESIEQAYKDARLTPDEAKDLLKVKYDISVSALKKLPEEKRSIITETMLMITPAGTVELDIELKPE